MARDGGLETFSIQRIYKMPEYTMATYYNSEGVFISPDTIVCPILFESWRDASFNTVKVPLGVKFSLSSNLAELYWMKGETALKVESEMTSSKVAFLDNGRLSVTHFRVRTASGDIANYYVAPVMIPKMTKFEVGGVKGVIKRDVSSYNRYEIDITLPASIDLTCLRPVFEIMNNDSDLTDGTNVSVTVNDQSQVSGTTILDASVKRIEYKIRSTMLGEANQNLQQEVVAVVKINIK